MKSHCNKHIKREQTHTVHRVALLFSIGYFRGKQQANNTLINYYVHLEIVSDNTIVE